MRPLLTRRPIIRNWEPRDADIFHLIKSDDRVMEYFPFRRDRTQSDAFLETLRARIEDKSFGFAALAIHGTGECIGFADSMPTALLRHFRRRASRSDGGSLPNIGTMVSLRKQRRRCWRTASRQ